MMLVIYSFSQNEKLEFNKVTYFTANKQVHFSIEGVDNQKHACQLSEQLLKHKSILKVDIKYSSESMVILDLNTSVSEFEKILKDRGLVLDKSSYALTNDEQIREPILEGTSEEDKKRYEKALDAWNNRNSK
jgi:hypothetical protein